MTASDHDAGGTIAVDCLVEAGDWPDEPHLLALAQRALDPAWAAAAMAAAGGEVSLVFTDDAHIRALNARWRGKDKPTNVLSFPAMALEAIRALAPQVGGQPLLLGDIVVAVETVRRECTAESKSFDDHLTHLLVHGFLHLLGYDHEEDGDADEMEALERRILHGLAIADPYA